MIHTGYKELAYCPPILPKSGGLGGSEESSGTVPACMLAEMEVKIIKSCPLGDSF